MIERPPDDYNISGAQGGSIRVQVCDRDYGDCSYPMPALLNKEAALKLIDDIKTAIAESETRTAMR